MIEMIILHEDESDDEYYDDDYYDDDDYQTCNLRPGETGGDSG